MADTGDTLRPAPVALHRSFGNSLRSIRKPVIDLALPVLLH